MKKRYQTPNAEVEIMDKKDILTSSNLVGWDTTPRQTESQNGYVRMS